MSESFVKTASLPSLNRYFQSQLKWVIFYSGINTIFGLIFEIGILCGLGCPWTCRPDCPRTHRDLLVSASPHPQVLGFKACTTIARCENTFWYMQWEKKKKTGDNFPTQSYKGFNSNSPCFTVAYCWACIYYAAQACL